MKLYSGIDLHSNNLTAAIMDETGKRILKKKLINDPEVVLATLEPYRTELRRSYRPPRNDAFFYSTVSIFTFVVMVPTCPSR
jgi:hypothetical protein